MKPHKSSTEFGINDPGMTWPLDRKKVSLGHILLDWTDPADGKYARAPFGHIAHLVPGNPNYFMMMRLVELTFPPNEWPLRKPQMEQALAVYFKAVGYAMLTPISRGWFGLPYGADPAMCGGSKAYGHTYLREPISFLKALNPDLDLSNVWDDWAERMK